MLGRKFVIAVAAAAIAGAATAEPSKTPVRNAVQPGEAKPSVVVASASQLPASAPTAEAPAPAPAKRVRTARISSCRCGGQAPTEN